MSDVEWWVRFALGALGGFVAVIALMVMLGVIRGVKH